jgi:phosphohistidine phosphatase
MKTLHLLRHAKSSWDDPGLDDIERPLNKRGRKACGQMAPMLAAMEVELAYAACSPAIRAQQTLHGILNSGLFGEETHAYFDAALYTFSASDLLEWLSGADDTEEEQIIVGHNPALTDLCNYLGDSQLANIPTCGYVRLQLNIESWHELGPGCGRLRAFITPRRK